MNTHVIEGEKRRRNAQNWEIKWAVKESMSLNSHSRRGRRRWFYRWASSLSLSFFSFVCVLNDDRIWWWTSRIVEREEKMVGEGKIASFRVVSWSEELQREREKTRTDPIVNPIVYFSTTVSPNVVVGAKYYWRRHATTNLSGTDVKSGA